MVTEDVGCIKSRADLYERSFVPFIKKVVVVLV